eukprot:INCI1215.1.p1 GENE.INCI1215.1~~INCI1215.1.p1  ORF type:complete len:438 (-),score=48.76 INCI1215.1:185-1498(-)
MATTTRKPRCRVALDHVRHPWQHCTHARCSSPQLPRGVEHLLFVGVLLSVGALFLGGRFLRGGALGDDALVEALALGLAGGSNFLGDSSVRLDALAQDAAAAKSSGVGVELDHDAKVLEAVLLATVGLARLLGRVEGGLDGVGVDDGREVAVGHDVAGQVEAGLVLVQLGEGGEGALGEDDEATDVASGSKLKEVQAGHVLQLNTGQVAERAGDAVVLVVHNERAAALSGAAVAHLAAAGAGGARVAHVLNVLVSADFLAQSVGGRGLGDALDGVGKHAGDLGNVGDAVSAGHDEGRDRRGGESRGDSVAALVLVDLLVPLAPDLGGCEHASATAHVAEGTLSGAGGTATSHTGDTGHSATGSPRLSSGLVAGVAVDGVGLAGVLGHLRVHEVDDVRADGGGEDGREGDGVGGSGDRDGRASGECHREKLGEVEGGD